MFSKTSYFTLILLILCYNSFAQRKQETFTVQPINKISEKYMGIDLQLPLDAIVRNLSKNQEIHIDTVIAHSDSSSFYFRCCHKSFNPFSIYLDSVRTIVAETRRVNIKENSSDTLLLFQIEGIAVGEQQIKNLSKRFNLLHKEFSPHFSYSSYAKTRKDKNVTGEAINYYIKGYASRVLNITWQKRNDTVGVIVISAIVPFSPY